MRESLSRIMTLTRRNIKEIIRDPLSLIFMIALPLAVTSAARSKSLKLPCAKPR